MLYVHVRLRTDGNNIKDLLHIVSTLITLQKYMYHDFLSIIIVTKKHLPPLYVLRRQPVGPYTKF